VVEKKSLCKRVSELGISSRPQEMNTRLTKLGVIVGYFPNCIDEGFLHCIRVVHGLANLNLVNCYRRECDFKEDTRVFLYKLYIFTSYLKAEVKITMNGSSCTNNTKTKKTIFNEYCELHLPYPLIRIQKKALIQSQSGN
jgi:hypothetical protein